MISFRCGVSSRTACSLTRLTSLIFLFSHPRVEKPTPISDAYPGDLLPFLRQPDALIKKIGLKNSGSTLLVLSSTSVSNHGRFKIIQGSEEKCVPTLKTEPIGALSHEESNLALFQTTGVFRLRTDKLHAIT